MRSHKGDRAKNRRRNFLAKQTRENKVYAHKVIPDKRKEYKRKFILEDEDVDDPMADFGGCPYGSPICCQGDPAECECFQHSDWAEKLQDKS